VADYVVALKLTFEPAFSWGVPHILRKRDRIIKQAKTQYMKTDQKCGPELLKTVKRALKIDAETKTTFWRDALSKEMGVIDPVNDIVPAGSRAPVGYTRMPCHVVFDIKMDFTRKARFVAGGHATEPPSTVTYASVVSRESLRIAFLIAALNDLDIMLADIQGAYLNAPCAEKVYTVCGPEFRHNEGRVGVIVKAFYVLKTIGYAWRIHLAETMRELNFDMCVADNDVWFRKAIREMAPNIINMCLF
jgi:Reverse transcriptase (RNA-dependent DNA polymerase)